MIIAMFNGWYFFWIGIAAAIYAGLYFLLRNKSEKMKRYTLFGLLLFALALHFVKNTFPPYSVDQARMFRDCWFGNICAANILLFPFIFMCKSQRAKDYMFYIGVLSGLLVTFYPEEPMAKSNQLGEQLDIIRFYIHHIFIWVVPLLMVQLGLHKLSYRRILWVPVVFLAVMLFIMMNQVLQSELGFVPLRGDDMLSIGYKNSSYLWGPNEGFIGDFLSSLCPDFFKTVPVGEFQGQSKYWPWFWLIVPVFVLVVPLSFGLSMLFDRKNFAADVRRICNKKGQRVSQ